MIRPTPGCGLSPRQGRGLSAAAALLSLALANPAAADGKIDTIKLANGNLVTGEIKVMEKGKLKYSTDSMGTVYVEWDEVKEITGKAFYRLQTRAGHYYFGAMKPGSDAEVIEVTTAGNVVSLHMANVVRIQPIESGWRDKLDSKLSAGYSYSKSSEVTEYTLAYNAVWVDDKFRLNFGGSGRSTDDGEETTSQAVIFADYRHWLENRNYWLATGAGEQNDELGLDARIVAGGGFGRRFWQTNLATVFGEGGVVVNHTENKDGTTDTDLEGLLRAGWEIYIHDTPKRTLDTTLAVFPGITRVGEYRTAFDITFSQELVEDFFFDLSFYHQYDSDVADEDASNSDYGVVTGIGYDF